METQTQGRLAVQRGLFYAIVILSTGGLLYLLAPVLTPFLFGALIAYLCNPLIERMSGPRVGRGVAVAAVFGALTIGLVLVVVLAVPVIEQQVRDLARRAPALIDWLRTTAWPWLAQFVDLPAEPDFAQVKAALVRHWGNVSGIASAAVDYASRSGLVLLQWTATLLLTPLVAFYLMRDWPRVTRSAMNLVPRHLEATWRGFFAESDAVLSGFIRGQLLVMLALGTFYALGLWVAGIPFGVLIGLGAGLLSIVPYLGFALGLIVAVLVAAAHHQDWLHPALVLGVFMVGQLLESFLLTPWLVGDRTGLHPLAVIFAVLTGGQLFGFFGVLLALPVAAVVLVLLRLLARRYQSSPLYGGDSAKGPDQP